MSIIHSSDYNDYIQYFSIKKENKINHGEVHTPYAIIKSMVELFPQGYFSDPNLTILDPGTGHGYYSIFLFHLLNKTLAYHFPNKKKRQKHILSKMLYMVEYNQEHIPLLKEIFGKEANIYDGDYLHEELPSYFPSSFDVIIGNPPYNSNGLKKVPTNATANKKKDGKTIWFNFIKRSMDVLKPKGYLSFIIPSIWMKPDKYGIYDYMLSYDIQSIYCLNNTETNTCFKGYAQTPTCYFLLKKEKTDYMTQAREIRLYDKSQSSYVSYPFTIGEPIPLYGASIIKKLMLYVSMYGSLKEYVKKTNMPPIRASISKESSQQHIYKNVRTCILKNKVIPELQYDYSNIPLSFHGVPKLIMAHKMYGFPYLDRSGQYGISNRDNYVLYNKPIHELKCLQRFLSTKFALYVFESTRYRMKYLEKYVFEFIPDITNIPFIQSQNTNHVQPINIQNIFHLSDEEMAYINEHTKKDYDFFHKV